MPDNGRRRTPDVLGLALGSDPERLRHIEEQNRARRSAQGRSRRWEQDNPAHSYRIPTEVHEDVKAITAEMNRLPEFRTTIGLTVTALLDHAIREYRAGRVEIYGTENRAVRRARPR